MKNFRNVSLCSTPFCGTEKDLRMFHKEADSMRDTSLDRLVPEEFLLIGEYLRKRRVGHRDK